MNVTLTLCGVMMYSTYFSAACYKLFVYVWKDELACRVEFLLEKCFEKEREEMEMTENVNKLLLENLLPSHVTNFFIGKTVPNQVIKHDKTHTHKNFVANAN